MTGNPYYAGPPSDHFDGVQFFNAGQPSTDRSPAELLRWKLGERPAAWPTQVAVSTARPETRVDDVAITMVGHASVLIQVAGLNLLLDPVWSERASPVSFAGPKRVTSPGIAFEDLPPIDVILVTHTHYDHLDAATLTRLRVRDQPRIITGLGTDKVIALASPGCHAEAGDWGDRFKLAGAVAVTLHPAHHWSARRLRDRRMALWCGFVIEAATHVIYVAGDTAYGDGAIFRQVQERFGPPSVAILPIGAYAPRWFMRNQHVDPEEAVRIMLACGAGQALGVHWGTFRLTDEARLAPVEALERACLQHGIDPGRFVPLHPGATWTPGFSSPDAPDAPDAVE